MHPYLTDRVLTGIPGLAHVAAIARAHHEHLDGSGYPLERVLVSVVLASGSSVQMLEAPVRRRLAPHVRVARWMCTWPTFKLRRINGEQRNADACAGRVGGGSSPSAAGTDPCPSPRQGWGPGRVHPNPPAPRPRASLERDPSRDEVCPPTPMVARRGFVDVTVPTHSRRSGRMLRHAVRMPLLVARPGSTKRVAAASVTTPWPHFGDIQSGNAVQSVGRRSTSFPQVNRGSAFE